MANFNSVDGVLDFAINEEEKAASFYTALADTSKTDAGRTTFTEFAAEEAKHKAKLLDVKAGKTVTFPKDKVLDLKLADYLVDTDPSPDMSYQDALILAMKKEKAAFKLYSDLAGQSDDAALKDLFLGLAQEEAKHKLRFEIEYDDDVMREN